MHLRQAVGMQGATPHIGMRGFHHVSSPCEQRLLAVVLPAARLGLVAASWSYPVLPLQEGLNEASATRPPRHPRENMRLCS